MGHWLSERILRSEASEVGWGSSWTVPSREVAAPPIAPVARPQQFREWWGCGQWTHMGSSEAKVSLQGEE